MPVALDETQRQWKILQIFTYYRLCIAIILIVLFSLKVGELSLGRQFPVLYQFSVGCYFLFALFSIGCAKFRLGTFNLQATIQVFVDIIVLTLLMYSSIGLNYGFGILINTSIAAGSIVTAGRTSLLFAACASIAVLLQLMLSTRLPWFTAQVYIDMGILGATFFATALLAYGLSSRIRASEALAHQRNEVVAKLAQLNELIIERMRSGILVVDEKENVFLINKAAYHLLGIDSYSGLINLEQISSNLLEQLKSWQANPRSPTKNFQTAHSKQGVIAQFASIGNELHGEKFNTLIILEDTAWLSQQTQQMKLASLGRLSASIAHEIRNPLSAINHAGQLLAESPHLLETDVRLTEIIREQCVRMNEVIENVLEISRRKRADPVVFVLKDWLSSFTRHFKLKDDGNNPVTIQVEPEKLEIFMDQGQLKQILTNLCENGLRFSQELTGRAQVTIAAGVIPTTNETFIEVVDNGTGVPADLVDKIFEPFFTTQSRGTGLGLYIAKELCEANHADLHYYPREQGGSCFRITLHDPIRMYDL